MRIYWLSRKTSRVSYTCTTRLFNRSLLLTAIYILGVYRARVRENRGGKIVRLVNSYTCDGDELVHYETQRWILLLLSSLNFTIWTNEKEAPGNHVNTIMYIYTPYTYRRYIIINKSPVAWICPLNTFNHFSALILCSCTIFCWRKTLAAEGRSGDQQNVRQYDRNILQAIRVILI